MDQSLPKYIEEQAIIADQSSKEWEASGDKVNAAYRSGMWYAYNDIRNRMTPQQDPEETLKTAFPNNHTIAMVTIPDIKAIQQDAFDEEDPDCPDLTVEDFKEIMESPENTIGGGGT